MLKALWRYRGFVLGSVVRDIRNRYQGSMLGFAWVLIGPLSMVLIYTLVFSQLMRARLPYVAGEFAYSIFLCAGMLAWGLFSDILCRSQNVFLDQGNLLKKANFPRVCLPVIVALCASFNVFVMFGIFSLFLALIGALPPPALLLLTVPVLVTLCLFSLSLGILLGTLNVFFRDVGPAVQIFLQFWFWVTPVVYPLEVLPNWVQGWVVLNPITGWVRALQDIFLFQRLPDVMTAVVLMLLTGGVFAIALLFYRRRAHELVELL